MAKRTLKEFGKRELIAEATRLALPVKQSMSKAQLIDTIERAQIEQQAKQPEQPEPKAILAKVEPKAILAPKIAPKVALKAAPKPIYRLLSNVMIGGAHIPVGTTMNLSAEDAAALLAQDAIELVK